MSRPRSACVTLFLAACGQAVPPAPPPAIPPPPEPVAVMGAITGANVVWGDALVRGDSAALAALYADDAVLMTSRGDLSGKDAIVAALLAGGRAGRDKVVATATTTDQLDVAGDRAYEAGTLTYTMASRGGATRRIAVRYVNFWQLTRDRWLLRRSLRPLP